jgi:hypothetical protein
MKILPGSPFKLFQAFSFVTQHSSNFDLNCLMGKLVITGIEWVLLNESHVLKSKVDLFYYSNRRLKALSKVKCERVSVGHVGLVVFVWLHFRFVIEI